MVIFIRLDLNTTPAYMLHPSMDEKGLMRAWLMESM